MRLNSNDSVPPTLEVAAQRLKGLGCDAYELYFEHQSSSCIESKEQQIETFSHAEDVGLSVRVVKNQRMGFSFTTSLEETAVHKAIESALAIAEVMPEDPFVNLVPLAKFEYPWADAQAFDPKGLAVSLPEKIAMAKELEAITMKADPRIKGVRNSTFQETVGETHLLDSGGRHLRFQATLFTASVVCKAEQAGDSQMGSEFGFSSRLDGLDIKNVGRLAAQWAMELLGAGSAPTMRCPAVFRNSVMADLIEFLSDSFSAEEIDKGRSMLAGKFGETLFSKSFTLIDDGTLANGYSSGPFDGEGTPTGRTVLVDHGELKGALYDAYYARKSKSKSTGNSVRGIKSPPSISHTNLFIEPGKTPAEKLLDGITRGVLITDLMGVHTANPVTGDFSLGASGLLIENGVVTRPVRGFAVAGNVLEVFKKIVDTGNDLKFFGSIGAPSARISEISVGGT